MGAAEKRDELVTVAESLLSKDGRASIAAIAEAIGANAESVNFKARILHLMKEEYRARTGYHIVQRGGELVLLDRGVAQWRCGKRLGSAAGRKSKRAIDVVRHVNPENLDSADRRSRERFLDREEGRLAQAKRVIVSLTEEEAKAIEQAQFKVRRERRPK